MRRGLNQYESFDPSDDYRRSECRRCEEKESDMRYAAEFLEEIVKQLYSTEEFNKHKFESDLDELCGYLNVKMRTSDLMIERFHEVQYV